MDRKDRRFMRLAWDASNESPCVKKQVGAALANKNRELVSRGYGGWLHACGPEVCEKKDWAWTNTSCFAIHAEVRVLILASLTSDTRDFQNCTMYVTHGPCDDCMKHMIYYGVGKVIYQEPYRTDYSKWKGYGIEVWQMGERII